MKYIYFEAQSGLLREQKPTVSNYYQYEIPDTPERRAWLETAMQAAKIGPSGLEYPAQFLKDLNARYLKGY